MGTYSSNTTIKCAGNVQLRVDAASPISNPISVASMSSATGQHAFISCTVRCTSTSSHTFTIYVGGIQGNTIYSKTMTNGQHEQFNFYLGPGQVLECMRSGNSINAFFHGIVYQNTP